MTPAHDPATLCELGQLELQQTRYLQALEYLTAAEAQAWQAADLDLLARLYLPLQEARRQKRQRCAEAGAWLDLIARPGQPLAAADIVARHPAGQLLVAGWESLALALSVRQMAREGGRYLECFLGAAFAAPEDVLVAVLPEDGPLPTGRVWSGPDELAGALPPGAIVLSAAEIAAAMRAGPLAARALAANLWQRLHAPLLARALALPDGPERLAMLRSVIVVDEGCELAHQHLAATARRLAQATS